MVKRKTKCKSRWVESCMTGLVWGPGRAISIGCCLLWSRNENSSGGLELEIFCLRSTVGWNDHSGVGVLFKWETWTHESVPLNLAPKRIVNNTWYSPFHRGWRASLWRWRFQETESPGWTLWCYRSPPPRSVLWKDCYMSCELVVRTLKSSLQYVRRPPFSCAGLIHFLI